MTPYHINVSEIGQALGGFLVHGNQLTTQGFETHYWLVPVISLKPTASISSGTGTYNNPYIVDYN